MKTINVKYQTKELVIHIEENLINDLSNFIKPNHKYFIITDTNVNNLYIDKIKNQINNLSCFVIEAGEISKNIDNVEKIISKMLENNIGKKDYIISFGGGVVGDIAGFIASIYKRGINYINIPTTLLSQVDSSLGGKNGLDFNNYKNQIGTIYHPELILIDPTFLKTLPQEEFLSGMGEVIKYGLCFDEQLFNSLFNKYDLNEIIYKALKIKAKITMDDEFENYQRISLNFGHTIAHAIESISNYQIKHGIAVLIGMLYEVQDKEIRNKLLNLYQKLDIKLDYQFDFKELKSFILKDKKVINQDILIPKLIKIGHIEVVKTNLDEYIRGLQ